MVLVVYTYSYKCDDTWQDPETHILMQILNFLDVWR